MTHTDHHRQWFESLPPDEQKRIREAVLAGMWDLPPGKQIPLPRPDPPPAQIVKEAEAAVAKHRKDRKPTS